jgi:hypothetical protein
MAALCHACWIERTAQIRDVLRCVFLLGSGRRDRVLGNAWALAGSRSRSSPLDSARYRSDGG